MGKILGWPKSSFGCFIGCDRKTKQLTKLRYVHMLEYSTAIKKNEVGLETESQM